MIYTKEVENMCPVAKGAKHEPAPIPEEGKWAVSYTHLDVYKRQCSLNGSGKRNRKKYQQTERL